MKEFTMVFTTRHRDEDAVKKDCNLICARINAHTDKYKFFYNGKELIIFHIFETEKEVRLRILFAILISFQVNTKFGSLDLQSYTKD